jgi:phosphoribosylformimino-5-aminoimidazole carboxamide ribotide isomerase
VDTRGGKISTSGWQETTQMGAEAVIERLQNRGVRSFVYTNVDKDGMLEGPTWTRCAGSPASCAGASCTRAGSASSRPGGARRLRQVNLGGVIVGKALYERKFTVREGQAALAPRRGGDGAVVVFDASRD